MQKKGMSLMETGLMIAGLICGPFSKAINTAGFWTNEYAVKLKFIE
jgi:hypothetical protein